MNESLTAKPGSWTSGTTFTYQWVRNGTAIKNATAASYNLVAADIGATISVQVTGSQPRYVTATETSSSTAAVAKGSLKIGTSTIKGTTTFGKTLTAASGTWTTGTTFTYQWLRSGKAISGATSKTYTLKAADAGKKTSVKVTGKKTGYTAQTLTSAKTSKIKK